MLHLGLALTLGYALSFASNRATLTWSVGQWIPIVSIRDALEQLAWELWQMNKPTKRNDHITAETFPQTQSMQLRIPTVHISHDYIQNPPALLRHLEQTYGNDWRKRPLLLQGLWSHDELFGGAVAVISNDENGNPSPSNPTLRPARHRRLTVSSLLLENLTIPYFSDATQFLLSPDAKAPVREIVYNMTHRRMPHKIGTQWLVQTYPELIQEVAPSQLLTSLFGNYFTPQHVKQGLLGGWLPPLTTVPVFMANTNVTATRPPAESSSSSSSSPLPQRQRKRRPFTALHCEPIGNVAVQLNGHKHWTLVEPQYSWYLQPGVARDGRAFFASHAASDEDDDDDDVETATENDDDDDDHERSATAKNHPHLSMQHRILENKRIPYYSVVTNAGDAVWVPTWTWHRVDYYDDNNDSSSPSPTTSQADTTTTDEVFSSIALGASLFHFRPIDFVINNPLFAILIIPALFRELIGYNTQ